MIEIKELRDEVTAQKVADFLVSDDAFSHVWFPDEKDQVRQAVMDSLSGSNHQYWYVEQGGAIIGAIGVRENHCNNGGYEMDADYIAVHKDHRRKHIATVLLDGMEEYVKQKKGRYIHILTCDINSYIPARAFYEARHYKKVGEIPNYYSPSEGRVDYFKEI